MKRYSSGSRQMVASLEFMVMRSIVGRSWILVAAVVIGTAVPVAAHETDQYSLPLDKPFADMGDLMDAAHLRMVHRAVERTNRQIASALREKQTPAIRKRLEALQSQDHLVQQAYGALNDAFHDPLDVESAIHPNWGLSHFPGQHVRFSPERWIYSDAQAWFDPRRLITVWRSGTIKAYGVYFGSDKLSHFHHMGRFYYSAWRENIAAGMSEEEAVANVVNRYSSGGPLGENGLLGFVATGVYSNADLVANYTGFKFYRNLTETVTLKGKACPPLCVRSGEFWRINDHVRPESGWFGAFVSDHWNEALNPNRYDVTLRAEMKRQIEKRAASVFEFWTKRDGRPADAAYFDALAGELSTYYGEAYGHSTGGEPLFTIGNTVMPALARPASGGGEAPKSR